MAICHFITVFHGVFNRTYGYPSSGKTLAKQRLRMIQRRIDRNVCTLPWQQGFQFEKKIWDLSRVDFFFLGICFWRFERIIFRQWWLFSLEIIWFWRDGVCSSNVAKIFIFLIFIIDKNFYNWYFITCVISLMINNFAPKIICWFCWYCFVVMNYLRSIVLLIKCFVIRGRL